MRVNDLKPFVGAKDFHQSLPFYQAIGFCLNFKNDDLAELELAGHRILLQNYYEKIWCENSMLFIAVESAQACFDDISAVVASEDYGDARLVPPRQQDYGALVTFVWDPSGVLLHFAEVTSA